MAGDLPTSYSYDEANRLTNVAIPAGTGDQGQFTALTPTRALDTRPAPLRTGTCDSPGCTSLAGGADTRTLQIAGVAGVPATGVDAVVINVTAITANPGVATVWPAGQTKPPSSNVNTPGGNIPVPNTAVVKLGANGKLSVNLNLAGDVIIDVEGWYAAPGVSTNTASVFTAVTPSRLVDTRPAPLLTGTCDGAACFKLAAWTPKSVSVIARTAYRPMLPRWHST